MYASCTNLYRLLLASSLTRSQPQDPNTVLINRYSRNQNDYLFWKLMERLRYVIEFSDKSLCLTIRFLAAIVESGATITSQK